MGDVKHSTFNLHNHYDDDDDDDDDDADNDAEIRGLIMRTMIMFLIVFASGGHR